MTVTRDGVAVAELRPLPRRVPSAAQLIERRRHLPRIDPERFRRDIDTGANCSFASADSWAEASPKTVKFNSSASRADPVGCQHLKRDTFDRCHSQRLLVDLQHDAARTLTLGIKIPENELSC